jgi:DNA-directed RNA polymerase specialized sigma24 family protein
LIPAKEATALKMSFLDGLSQTEIAESLKIATRTVRRRMDAGIGTLQKRLSKETEAPPPIGENTAADK